MQHNHVLKARLSLTPLTIHTPLPREETNGRLVFRSKHVLAGTQYDIPAKSGTGYCRFCEPKKVEASWDPYFKELINTIVCVSGGNGVRGYRKEKIQMDDSKLLATT
jgi:hypothetical protein